MIPTNSLHLFPFITFLYKKTYLLTESYYLGRNMDRNLRHNSYPSNNGPRSLPHIVANGNGKGRQPGMSRLSPPTENNNSSANQHDDLINYIYDSWNKVSKEIERGGDSSAKYYQDAVSPRQLANFRPFDLEEWWGKRLMQSIKRQQHRS